MHLQTICYRSSQSELLKHYKICTVTYGTKSTLYLATRCLVELSSSAPSARSQRAILEDFYVDDLLSGGNSDKECLQIYEEVSNTLKGAGMHLRKWCTSSQTLLNQLTTSESDPNYMLQLNENEQLILWVLLGTLTVIALSLHLKSGIHLFV